MGLLWDMIDSPLSNQPQPSNNLADFRQYNIIKLSLSMPRRQYISK